MFLLRIDTMNDGGMPVYVREKLVKKLDEVGYFLDESFKNFPDDSNLFFVEKEDVNDIANLYKAQAILKEFSEHLFKISKYKLQDYEDFTKLIKGE